jgi:hypothetical protein
MAWRKEMIFIDQIYDFNLKAGLLDKPYYDILESSFQIEEALEGFNLPVLIEELGLRIDSTNSAKGVSRYILESQEEVVIPDVERLDKACDAIVFAFGSIFKLGLNQEQASRALSVVMSANLQKLSMPKDEFGKLTKPADFVGPEVSLQAILDERHK